MSLCSEKLTLWILVGGSPGPTKFFVEWNNSPPDLDDLAHKLCKEDTFEKVKPNFLEFFNHNDRINALRKDTLVTNSSTTAASPLVVHYPLFNSIESPQLPLPLSPIRSLQPTPFTVNTSYGNRRPDFFR